VALAAVAMLWLVRSGRAHVVGATLESPAPSPLSPMAASGPVTAPEPGPLVPAPRAAPPSSAGAFVPPPADRTDTRTVLGLLARDWLRESPAAGAPGDVAIAPLPTTTSPADWTPARRELRLPDGDDHQPVGGIAALLLAAPEWAAPPPTPPAPAAVAARPAGPIPPKARPPAPSTSELPSRPRRSRCHQGNTFGFS
jgi:hypothetical protein